MGNGGVGPHFDLTLDHLQSGRPQIQELGLLTQPHLASQHSTSHFFSCFLVCVCVCVCVCVRVCACVCVCVGVDCAPCPGFCGEPESCIRCISGSCRVEELALPTRANQLSDEVLSTDEATSVELRKAEAAHQTRSSSRRFKAVTMTPCVC